MGAHGMASCGEAAYRQERFTARVVVDARGRVVGWNGGAERLLGYSAAEAVGRSAAELLGPELLGDAGGWHGEIPIRHRDGRRLYLSASAYAAKGAVGYEWLLKAAHEPEWLSPDVEAQALSDWVFSGSPVALTVYDSNLRAVRQNAAMRRLSGVSDEDRRGQGLGAVLVSLDVTECETRMRRVLETGQPEVDFLVRGRTPADPDHERVFQTSATPVRDRDGGVLGVCTTVLDVTEQHRNRERLALLNEASTCIGSTLDVARTAQELVDLVVPRLTDFATVDLVEVLLSGGEPAPGPVTGPVVLRRVAHQSVLEGAPESVVRVGDVDVYPADSPPARCLATGRSQLHRGLDEDLRRWMAKDPARSVKARDYGLLSCLNVPVTARGTTLGVVYFSRWRREEPFEEEDLTLAEELVARAAVCLDNARRFTRERTAALALQRSLLSQRLPEQSAVRAASCYLPSEPRLGVGGDWFDVIPLSGARVALVVGDVVGHGIEAAAAMGRLRTAVRTLADVDLAPDELLTQLDDLVIQMSVDSDADGGVGGAAGESGATCLYAIYDPVSGTCSMACAGHPAPIVVHPDGTTTLLDLPAGPPLGVGGLPFEAIEVDLPEDSLLALYTDGLVESRTRGLDEGLDALGRALTTPVDSLEALCSEVVEALLPGGPDDDAALLLARPRPLSADKVVSWDVPADPAVVARVRAQAARQLEVWGLEEAGFVTELVVSELVTNAIRYGAAPIQLRLIHDRTLVCEVCDGSNTAPHLRRARVFDEGGRGLLLVAQLTARWGSRQHARGKIIWCEQSLSGAEASKTSEDRPR
ncbi:SpoIIE family protein phosphatase [Streptomyces sp. NPDC001833]|uniref:SpoIIE family protein phosphatase n=1 Tax=Streptomyces sp. NPDC001833 TaxID=3154658 RepID=UPI00332DAE27